MFIDYLKEKYIEEYELVLKLLDIDEKIQGISMDLNIFTNLKNRKLLDFSIKKEHVFILEGNVESFVYLLNQFIGYSNTVIVNRNNLAINKWIYKKYIEYCDIHNIDIKVNVNFTNNFDSDKGYFIIIGSKPFVLEYESILSDNKKGIIFE